MRKIVIVALLLIVAFLVWWLVAPLFITKTVSDPIPAMNDTGSSVSTTTIRIGEAMITGDTDLMSEPIEVTTQSEAVQVASGVRGPFAIEDTPGHPATGQVRIFNGEDGDIVRFENYQGTNGPDLLVYLATDLDATEFFSLGRAKGNEGNINYTVPEGVNIDDYQYVMTWCRAFGVLFDYAQI